MRILGFIALAGCRQPAPPTGTIDPAAVPLLDALADALGGRARLGAVHAIHETGACIDSGVAYRFETWATEHGELRETSTTGDLTVRWVYDGHRGWDQDASGLVIELGGADLDQRAAGAYLASNSALISGRLAGAITKIGDSTLRLVPDVGKSPIEVTLDPATHLPVRIVRLVGSTEVTTEPSDWRDIEGMRVAFQVRTTGETVETCTIAVVDQAASTFEPPVDRHDDVHFTSGSPVVRPLDVRDDSEARAEASIAGSPLVPFIVDTGASTMLDAERISGLHPIAAGTVSGAGFVDTFGVATGIVIGLPGVTLGPYALHTMSFDKNYPNIDKAIAGLLGAELFEHLVVELDYPQRTMRLYDPATYRHPTGGTQLPFVYSERSPMIAATLETSEGALAGNYMIDTGCACEVVAMHPFAAAHPAVRKATAIQLGDVRIAHPAVTTGALRGAIFDARQMAGLIGGKLLRRYRVTFDYPARTMWLD